MSSEQVWYRFEGKKKDGSVMKLRIQDLPPSKLNDAIDLLINIYVRDEAVYRAVVLICCDDDTPDVTNLMGLVMTRLNSGPRLWIEGTVTKSPPEGAEAQEKPQEITKLHEITYEFLMSCNPGREFNVEAHLYGICMVIYPAYRGLGLAGSLLKSCRLVCKSLGVPMIGAWMTAFGTQIAGARDGWETVKEIEFDYLAKKYDVTFTDVPRTMKFMIARVGSTGST